MIAPEMFYSSNDFVPFFGLPLYLTVLEGFWFVSRKIATTSPWKALYETSSTGRERRVETGTKKKIRAMFKKGVQHEDFPGGHPS